MSCDVGQTIRPHFLHYWNICAVNRCRTEDESIRCPDSVCVCVCMCNRAGLIPDGILCHCPFNLKRFMVLAEGTGSCDSPQHTDSGRSDFLSAVTLSF